MYTKTIVSLLGEIFGWLPETGEFISTVQRDGKREIVRSRISSKVWSWFLDGINVRLFRELQGIKDCDRKFGAIDASLLYRGGRKEKIVLCWNTPEGLYSVSYGDDKILSYDSLDRAMLMFSLILETRMRVRMESAAPASYQQVN